MTPDELIAETLRLDAEATRGPWTFDNRKDEGSFGSPRGPSDVCHFGSDGTGWCGDNKGRAPDEPDVALILSYRTSAPRLARMLRVAINELAAVRNNGSNGIQNVIAANALAEIERLAKEEA